MPDSGRMRDAHWIALFLGYCLLQALARLVSGPALGLDEAEALYHARDLALGYGPQPPLYFWLQWGLFQVLGPGLPALSLLKYALLAGTFVVMYRLLREVAPPAQAGVAVLGFGFVPQILWEAQRDLTHSVIVLFMAVAALALGWRALRSGLLRDHAAFGIVIGLGMLSKYNFAFVPLGILGSALLLAPLRARLRPGGWALAAGAAALVLLPAAAWVLGNPAQAGASIAKLGMGAEGVIAPRLRGAGVALFGAASFFALAAVVLGPFALWRRRLGRGEAAAAGAGGAKTPLLLRFLAASCGLALLAVLAMVVVSGSTAVKDRWLIPFAAPLVPVVILWLLSRLPARALPMIGGMAAALWVLAAVLLPVAGLSVAGYRSVDFAALAARLEAAAPRPGGTVVAQSPWLAGNLLRVAPGRDVRLPAEVGETEVVAVVAAGDPAPILAALGLQARAGAAATLHAEVWRRALTLTVVPVAGAAEAGAPTGPGDPAGALDPARD